MASSKNLKLKFKLQELEFELEGDEATVKDEFENFKSFVTNDILPKINQTPVVDSSSQLKERAKPLALNQSKGVDAMEVSDFPVMKEILHRDLPKNEQEWILIYAFYASEFGSQTFNRDDISDLYESSNRKTADTVRHLSRDLKRVLTKGYIKFVNDKDYIIKPEGIAQAKLIIEGKSNSKPSSSRKVSENTVDIKNKPNSSSKKTKSTNKTSGFKLDRNLNLRPEGKLSLVDFAEGYNTETTPQRILLIVYYLKEVLEMKSVNSDHIYTGFDKLNIRPPKSLYQLISDTKNKFAWLEFDNMDNIDLAIEGRNAIKYDLVKK